MRMTAVANKGSCGLEATAKRKERKERNGPRQSAPRRSGSNTFARHSSRTMTKMTVKVVAFLDVYHILPSPALSPHAALPSFLLVHVGVPGPCAKGGRSAAVTPNSSYDFSYSPQMPKGMLEGGGGQQQLASTAQFVGHRLRSGRQWWYLCHPGWGRRTSPCGRSRPCGSSSGRSRHCCSLKIRANQYHDGVQKLDRDSPCVLGAAST